MDTGIYKWKISHLFSYTQQQNNFFSQNCYQTTKMKFLKDYTHYQALLP